MATYNAPREQSRIQRPVRVLFISPFSSLYGADLCLLEAALGLDKQRFVPTVVLGGDGPLADRLRTEGIAVEILPMPYMTHRGRQAVQFVWGVLPAVLRLAGYIRRKRFDLIYNNILQNPYGALAAHLSNVPCLWHIDEMGQNPLLRWGITRMAGLLADRIVVVSKAVGNMFSSSAQKKIRLVYNGVDTEYYNPKTIDRSEARRALSISPSQPVVGFVGRLHPSKRPQDLLYAMADIRQRWTNCLLLFAGDGPLRQDLEETVVQLGLRENVRFLGYMSDLRAVLSAIDVFAMPSDHEAVGRVQLEAMAMSKPVVATAVGGIPETVTPETGRLVSVGQPHELAAAISFVLENQERATEMGCRGRERILRDFSMESYIHGLQAVMMEILLNKKELRRSVRSG